MKQIPVYKKRKVATFALVDDEDFERVNQYKWKLFWNGSRFYVTTSQNGKPVGLHDFILGTKPVDHKDNDPLNNRRKNLRACTISQNNMNRTKPQTWRNQKCVTSQYKGVSFYPNGKYQAKGWFGKQFHLGYFNTETEAARVYNQFAQQHFGEFARLNNV